MTEHQFLPKTSYTFLESGSVAAQSPSNIALVKYWGKYGEQLPKNASVSFTLSQCRTETTLSFERKQSEGFEFEVYLEGKKEDAFKPKIQKFFERIERYVPFLTAYSFTIETKNTFPHSSGIASSASGMSALALCLVAIEQLLSSEEMTTQHGTEKASFLARLGSGSASRSLQGPLVVWGKHSRIEGSSDLVGTPYPYAVHSNFQSYHDTILLVDTGEKQVSSTVGHNLMHEHPFATLRFAQANEHLEQLITVFETGDRAQFITIVEGEALSLHAMMMTSNPYFVLMKPNTLEIINRIWKFRKETGSSVCFTLDAGANVHVLYPSEEKEGVSKFIRKELAPFCKDGAFIDDTVGTGASLL
ncbi:diphosphomevalonate decarboxylase [Altibacter sp. HG106]|uniref:diphosphomevalonate decarboxylase n=1 Tax=Altibacter sp. HG106 TaxID=3023937 RepID=UPI00234FF5A8|nr:diphosphomevalonate decarboxylase [Altibacter sp. HG106]MDC7994212.1 diphosphomevalonate decarboxylase [Altibacter sp. HG106]